MHGFNRQRSSAGFVFCVSLIAINSNPSAATSGVRAGSRTRDELPWAFPSFIESFTSSGGIPDHGVNAPLPIPQIASYVIIMAIQTGIKSAT